MNIKASSYLRLHSINWTPDLRFGRFKLCLGLEILLAIELTYLAYTIIMDL